MAFNSYIEELNTPQKPYDVVNTDFLDYCLSPPTPCFTDIDSISFATDMPCLNNSFSSMTNVIPSRDAPHNSSPNTTSNYCSSDLLKTAVDISGLLHDGTDEQISSYDSVVGVFKETTTPVGLNAKQITVPKQYTHQSSFAKRIDSQFEDLPPSCLFNTPSGYSSRPLSLRIAMLQLQFLNMNRLNRKQTVELQNMYKTQAGNLERERFNKLSVNHSTSGSHYEINRQYDTHHEKLINHVERSLSLIENHSTKQLPNAVNIRKKSFSQFIPSVVSSCASLNSLCQTPQKPQQEVFKFGNNMKSVQPRKIIKATSVRNVSALNSDAINIMRSWYECNKDYPYPSQETCKVLASNGNINVSQVRKWFSNKRTRDNNTRSHEEISKLRYKRKISTEPEELQCEKRQRVE